MYDISLHDMRCMQRVLYKETLFFSSFAVSVESDSVSSKLHWLRTPPCRRLNYASYASKMSGGGTNMCDVVDIPGVAVKATFCSRVCVGGEKEARKSLSRPLDIQQCSEND